jgi:sulfatase maturation enzyme AslB (radical SAM superfamily)
MSNIKCAVPFLAAFSNNDGGFRNCCSAYPATHSKPGESFEQWWTGDQMIQFRQQIQGDELPAVCNRCAIQEKVQGSSFRTAINKNVDLTSLNSTWPDRWNLIFGSKCNLACWSCNENSSTTIEQHKRTIGILPVDFESPEIKFNRLWPKLQQDIILSYNYHETVTLTILGGEPLYNQHVLNFLSTLQSNGLGIRTRLEFHTNATKLSKNHVVSLLLPGMWQHVCMFLSLDAIGSKAEWLRYGTKWSLIETNIDLFKKLADYVEVHCILGVLNIGDLVELTNWCVARGLPLRITTLSSPEYMALESWDSEPELLADCKKLEDAGLTEYYSQIGKRKQSGSHEKLVQYIKQFDNIRRPLRDFSPDFALRIGL